MEPFTTTYRETTRDSGRICKHCALPVSGSDSLFCCTGCAIAYEAIEQAGLSETYYKLRRLVPEADGVAARPGSIPVLVKQQLASDRFIQESTLDFGDGQRQTCVSIDGLTCAACGWLVEQIASAQDGVKNARVNLPDATLTFEFDGSTSTLGELVDELSSFGYDTYPLNNRRDGPSPAERNLLTRVGVSWALAGNAMLLAFALYSGLSLENERLFAAAARWVSLLIASVSVVYGGSIFFKKAWESVRRSIATRSIRQLHIDTPISVGILVGYLASAWATLAGSGEVWFDSITVLIAALLTSRWLQMRSQRKAAQIASRLLDLVPSTARTIGPDGSEEYVPSTTLEPGVTVRVDPGEVIPADGQVLSGSSTINNAVITGESAPVSIGPGDEVFAGATNQTSSLLVRSSSGGSHTRVGQLLEWLRASDGTEAPVETAVDRISGYFVVVILTVAVVTSAVGLFLFPGEVAYRLVALLVISCPCALGMATPLAIAVTNGKAAGRGIYIKDGRTVEALARIDTVVFDKTGTLTAGNVEIAEIHGSREAVVLGAHLEERVIHPLAAAIVNFAHGLPTSGLRRRSQRPDVQDFTSKEGAGVSGTVGGEKILLGKPEWVLNSSDDPSGLQKFVRQFGSKGLTPVLIAINGTVQTAIGFGDAIRSGAKNDINSLRVQGKNVYLLSGDDRGVVDSVARAVGIKKKNAFARVMPEAKGKFVQDLATAGESVLMIGDGINDTAALKNAAVGVAVGNENAPCLVASDIFVPKQSAAVASELIEAGGRVMRLIKRNLALSLAYNVVAGGAAIMGLVTPLVAAIAMPISSLIVVGTSIAVRPFGDRVASTRNVTSTSIDHERTPKI